MSKTKIEWTEETWNPITGCSIISTGCKNCYAERGAHRLKAMGQAKYINKFDLTIHEKCFDIPLAWKKPRMIFVNSMSDLFHENVPFTVIKRIFETMNNCPRHIFQILTKRSNVLKEYCKFLNWTDNIWMGVTVESQDYMNRIKDLKETPANIKFISFEPLLSKIDNLNLEKIDWVIVGGESGPGFRTIKKEWIVNIRDECIVNNVPFFFKQWGGFNKKKNGRILDGKEWNEMPNL